MTTHIRIRSAVVAGTVAIALSVRSHASIAQRVNVAAEWQSGVRSAQEVGVDVALVKRWAQLFAYILEDFQADHRDPTASMEGDFATREIRIRTDLADSEEWVGRTLTEDELRAADIRALAKELYAESTPVRRWATLVAYVLDEFKRDDRDPTGKVETDFASRTIRVVGAAGSTGTVRTLTSKELATADLRVLAKQLYNR
jgi:hypothetical protein